MRASALASLLAVSLIAPSATATAQGIFLPQSPIGPGGEDSIETAEGTRCRQSINNSGAYADMGVVGNKAQRPDYRTGVSLLNNNTDYALAYMRVTIPLGAKPKRLDCTRVYDMEISRLKREIELLRMTPE
ncbi:hypothetical protein M9980_09240 [Sphingomonas donggukensis]|uniref:Uncharacterized protein n=1 Tax=Sphingomonas donggukensis TaxID=2949093 RepID=A0ABY4TWS7_9SPHN|nr:hypothetical protein [Sphingomonas donggukensis]URW74758.1 hypothetical protein M9980_09240 [Sphingomonas donggukensis]